MDRTLVRLVVPGVVLVAIAVAVLTRVMVPLAGYGLALVLYWALLAGLLWFAARRHALVPLLRIGQPRRGLVVMLALPAAVVGIAAAGALPGSGMPLWAFGPILIAALLNGTLEEAFWRGALLPRPARWQTAAAVALFTAWHLALVPAAGITLTGGAPGMLAGAAALGVLWMAARLMTNALGPGILSHVALNLAAFTELAARNWP